MGTEKSYAAAPERRHTTIGFSPTRTRYKLHRRDGQQEYARCGADILLNGLNFDLKGEATCPVCGNVTRLAIKDRRIVELNPKEAILHIAETTPPGNMWRPWIACESTHLFDNPNCLEKWVSTYSGIGGLVKTVQEYHSMLITRLSQRVTSA